jgi:hypothetical protein
MWAPLAAIVFAIGVFNTPSMIEAERSYLRDQEPVMDVEEIQAAEAKSGGAPESDAEIN